MAIRDVGNQSEGLHEQVEVITSNWMSPLECLVPQPELAEPIKSIPLENAQSNIKNQELTLGPNEVLMAHETSQDNAEKIVENGFKTERKGFTPLRDRAVFGWIHTEDIGKFNQEFDEAGHVVLYKSDKQHCYISSYESSASQLILGQISGVEYEQKHVMKYGQYEQILWNYPELVEHLPYSKKSLLDF